MVPDKGFVHSLQADTARSDVQIGSDRVYPKSCRVLVGLGRTASLDIYRLQKVIENRLHGTKGIYHSVV
jgi:hypothetical protein